MNSIDTQTSKLLDIIGPSVPVESINYSSLFITTVIILATITLLFKLYRSGFKYKILIFLLKRELKSSNITSKQAAYKLANILQSAHDTNRLSIINIGISELQKQNWQEFITQLSDYRYDIHEIDKLSMLNLIDRAKSWTTRTYP